MNARNSICLITVLTLLLAGPAFAMKAEVMLRDGTAGIVEVLNTTESTVTVQFEREGVKIKLTLKASELDPHSYYDVRRDHMAETAENHLKLAEFCIESGLYAQAKYQIALAERMDPELVREIREDPLVREKVGEIVLANARKSMVAGDFEDAEYQASQVAARWPETKAAAAARDLLGKIQQKSVKAEADRVEKEAEAVRAAADAEQKKAAEDRQKTLAPIHALLKRGLELQARARADANTVNSRDAFEASAAEGEKALKLGRPLLVKSDAKSELRKLLLPLLAAARDLAVDGWVYAGNVLLERGSFPNAEKNANRALAVDAGNAKATSLLARIQTARAQDDTFDARWRRSTRTPVGRR